MNTEHLVFLTNLDGDRAKICFIRCDGNGPGALGRTVSIARSKMCMSFVVIERDDSEEGFSDQCIYRQISGVRQS